MSNPPYINWFAVCMMCMLVSARGLQCFGPTGRWRTQLMNKILAAGASYDDVRISPVIRYVPEHTLVFPSHPMTQLMWCPPFT